MIATLILPPALRVQIETEARAAFPRECCGLMEGVPEGDAVRAIALHTARNLATRADRFEIDPADHFAALRTARANGNEIVGCYHSHPNGHAEPSQRDAEFANDNGFVWLIAALSSHQHTISAYVVAGHSFVSLRLLDEQRKENGMDYRALLGVAVRVLGLVLIWSGIYDGFFSALQKAGLEAGAPWTAGAYELFAGFHILAGLIVVKAANFIVDLAYDFRGKSE
jgi:proteasome lid subunit RPN8/RPN11